MIEWREESLRILFQERTKIQGQIDARAGTYLKAIGYDWYKLTTVEVKLDKRGSRPSTQIEIVTIVAELEINHTSMHVNLDVPLIQFEALAPAKADGTRQFDPIVQDQV